MCDCLFIPWRTKKKKVIYLGCNLLVLKDIDGLFNTDISFVYCVILFESALNGGICGFSSNVVLLNCEKIRKDLSKKLQNISITCQKNKVLQIKIEKTKKIAEKI